MPRRGQQGSKTFALAAAREAWADAGFTVIGAAVARRASVELVQRGQRPDVLV